MIKVSQHIKKLKLNTRKKVLTLFIGNFKSAFKGRGVDYEDLREYVPGDNVKDIDWNATARSDTVYVRKYIETRELEIFFGIDTSSSMKWKIDDELSNEQVLLDFLLIICFAAIRNGDRIGATFYNDTIVQQIPVKKGRSQMLRILNETQKEFQRKSYYSPTDHKTLLRHLIKVVHKRSLCFMITDNINHTDKELLQLLKAAGAKHDLILITIDNMLELIKKHGLPSNLEDIETGLEVSDALNEFENQSFEDGRMSYRLELQKSLRRNRVDSIFLDSSSDILLDLILFFKKKSQNRNLR